jgi:hypothetical protein
MSQVLTAEHCRHPVRRGRQKKVAQCYTQNGFIKRSRRGEQSIRSRHGRVVERRLSSVRLSRHVAYVEEFFALLRHVVREVELCIDPVSIQEVLNS